MASNEGNRPAPTTSDAVSSDSQSSFSLWVIEKRVILTRLSGAFNREDSIAGIRRVGEMMQQGEAPVHLIMDMRGTTNFTTNFREIIPEIMQFRQQMTKSWTVMITEAKLIRFFGTLVANTLRGRFQIATSVEDALTLLLTVDTSLRALSIQPYPTYSVDRAPEADTAPTKDEPKASS
ncbi:MAG: hypothetical protein U0670_06635 [Anaerolineae bacterium]